VFFLEGSRFVIPFIPEISHVQGAALRECLIALALLVVLRVRAQGLIPERIADTPLPEPKPAAGKA
jgi:branched-chain amino acid transport system permease protein